MRRDSRVAPHRSYLQVVRPLIERDLVKGLAHITGGGITENLPRTLPEECAAVVELTAWDVPPIFRLLQQRGGIARDEMFRAFNMGVGLVVVCAAADADRALSAAGPDAFRIGSIVAGDDTVRYR